MPFDETVFPLYNNERSVVAERCHKAQMLLDEEKGDFIDFPLFSYGGEGPGQQIERFQPKNEMEKKRMIRWTMTAIRGVKKEEGTEKAWEHDKNVIKGFLHEVLHV